MKKKLSKISVLLVLMLTLAVCFAFGASAEETTYTEGYYTYTVTDGKATITAVDTAISGDITTPATLGGYPVTVIGKEAFYHCSGITSLVVSEGVEVIDYGAFNDIGKVDSIVLPDSLTTLGEQPFTWVEVDSITVPKNVSSIAPTAFMGCFIKEIYVDAENPYFCSDENGILYNKDKTELLTLPSQYPGTSFTMPETVKKVDSYGLYLVSQVETLVLPEGLEELAIDAIGLLKTKKLEIPASLTIIDYRALSGMFWLEEIVVDEDNPNYSSLDGVLFNKDKTELVYYPEGKPDKEYAVPETVTKLSPDIHSALFLRKLIIQSDIEAPGYTSTRGTVTDIVFEKNVTVIPEQMFSSSGIWKNVYIKGLNTEITSADIFKGYSKINYDPDEYSEATRKMYEDLYLSPKTEAESNIITQEYNDKYPRSYYDTPVNNATLHCHEGSAAETFAQKNNLSYSTTHFYKDDSEWVLDFENNTATRECLYCTVTEKIYGYDVTDGEASIGKVYVELTGDVYVPETLDGYPVTGIEYFDSNFDNLYIHEGIKEIAGGAFDTTLGNIIVDENNPYFVVEDGALYDINKERLIKYFASNERTYFELPESVATIDGYAFCGAAYLEEIKLNEGLKEIGEFAFPYANINNIEFPSTLETIGECAFVMCPMLKEFTVPANVKNIGSTALFTYFPVDIYLVGIDITFDEWEFFGVVDIEMDCTREEFAELLLYAVESRFSDEAADAINAYIKFLDAPAKQHKIYCHEGASFVDLMDAAAADYGVEDLYEYTHFFKNWTYDWEGLERTAKCLYCDETTTESLRSEEDNEIEFIAPADEETTFVVETVEDAESDDYILVTEALEAVEGPAEIEKIYDITLETSEGVAVQPDGSVQVKLPVEESHGNYKVFRVNDDGTYTDMNATVVDGYVVFVTDHFSLYVVIDTTEKTCEHEFDYTKSEANLTRPSQVDGTWVDGYYTYTCSLCGETETEVAKRADYTEYYVVETRFVGVLLNEDIDVNIRQKLLDELQATEVGFEENFIESEQQTLDRFTDYLLACTERAEVCVAGTHYFTKYNEVTAPKCGVAGLEKSVCDYCGAEDEKEIPALKHSPLAAVKEKEVAPTCEAAGSYDSVVYCDLCGGEISRETVTVSATGHSKVTVPGKAATCKETGLTDGVKCSVCGKILTAQKTIAKADHKDKNGDYKCDYGCGHEFERPTPDKCDHMCHQSGFMGFIWKIVQFFWKLFKMNPVCECGAAHY